MASWICPRCNIAMPVGIGCENCGRVDDTSPVISEKLGGHTDQVARDTLGEHELDEMVARASVPNLAALFKNAKEQGLIAAQQDWYHENVGSKQ